MSSISSLTSSDVVTRDLLERRATEAPDEEFAFFPDGSSWTRRQALEIAYEAANALRDHGVKQGDVVSVFLPNGGDYLRVWWGAAVLGATLLPVNTSFRGGMLRNLFELGQPVLLVTNEDFAERVHQVGLIEDGLKVVDHAELRTGNTTAPELERPIFFGDVAVLALTSGTTGPSKLVQVTYLQAYVGGEHFIVTYSRGAEDTFLADLPMFHNASLYMITGCLASRTKIAVREVPAMTNYWEVARDTGATLGIMIATMLSFFAAQEPRPAEREHKLRAIIVAPVPNNPRAFLDRFGIEFMLTNYGSTETPGPLCGIPDGNLDAGYVGSQRDGFECRVVDDNDIEVPHGTPGQLIVRTDDPWWITPAYYRNPEATAEAWRNGWFHTGDMFRRDDEGRFFFVDRLKDALRRRGENISSAEVEVELISHPLVAEVAVVPHREDGGTDDEVKAWIVPAEGAEIDPADLLTYSVERMPHFMVPRYFEFVDALPKTPTLRVKKFELRERGNTPGQTWDREEQGYSVTRNGLAEGAGAPRA